MKWILGVAAVGLLVVLTIAGSDKLFVRTVPLEQRLVSHDEGIRTRAQQELLGLSSDQKRAQVSRLLPTLSAPDPFVRKWSAIALALLGPASQEAAAGLLDCVADSQKDVAQACRVALAEIGTPDASLLPLLVKAFDHPSPALRCEAAAAVTRMGAEARDAIPAFVSLLRTSPDWPDCLEDAEARFAQSLKEFSDALMPLLHDEQVETRRRSVSILASIDPKTAEIVEALLKVLGGDDDPRVRRAAARALGLRRPPDRGLTPALVAASEAAPDEAIRAIAFNRLRGSDASPTTLARVIAGRLRDDSATIRLNAVEWVAQRGAAGRAAIPTLLRLLSDSDPKIRRTALETLRHLKAGGVKTWTAVAKAQRDAPPDVRCVASEWLAEAGQTDRISVALLAKDLSDPGDGWRCAADVLAFAARGNRDVVPALAALMNQPDREIRRRAVHVAAQMGSRMRPLRPALRKAAQDDIPGASLALQVLRELR